jgi:hypothetical protein
MVFPPLVPSHPISKNLAELEFGVQELQWIATCVYRMWNLSEGLEDELKI